MFLKIIYFLPAIAFIYYECYCITMPAEVVAMSKLVREKGKKAKDLAAGEIIYTIINLCYVTWALIGLFSSQWFPIIHLFLIGFIPKKWNWWVVVDSLISIVDLFFIILNAFHFHINTFKLVLNYFI